MPITRLPAVALSLTALALIVAGCGGSSTTSSSSSSQPTQAPASNGGGSSSAASTVSTADNPELGTILVNANGMTLYDFEKDSGTKSSCYGACAKIWPPLTTSGPPQAGEGAMSSKLGTSTRTDGTTQVTYDGHPLYTYTADSSPGEANGDGIASFGGTWHALGSSGSAAEASAGTAGEATTPAPAESGGGSGSGSSGGYGY